MPDHDVRFLESDEIEIRAVGEGEDKQRFVEGLGIVYNRETEIWPGFFETIAPGAFDRSVTGKGEIRSYFNHNPSMVLSTTKSKPRLHLEETERGLRFKSPIPPTSYGNDLRVNLERKNVRGASFSFTADADGETYKVDEQGAIHRTVTKGKMYEIGPVTNPAYPTARVGMRDAETAARDARAAIEAAAAIEKQAEADKNRAELDQMKRRLSILTVE